MIMTKRQFAPATAPFDYLVVTSRIVFSDYANIGLWLLFSLKPVIGLFNPRLRATIYSYDTLSLFSSMDNDIKPRILVHPEETEMMGTRVIQRSRLGNGLDLY